jgi:hypothetical protein
MLLHTALVQNLGAQKKNEKKEIGLSREDSIANWHQH